MAERETEEKDNGLCENFPCAHGAHTEVYIYDKI